jgi:glycosyltransferase involved in cell wall biosynthesis
MGDRFKRAGTIAFVTHEFTRTGAPYLLLECVRAASAQGHRCVVFGPPRGPVVAEFSAAGVEIVPVPAIPWLYLGAKRGKIKLLFIPVRFVVNCWLQLVFLFLFSRVRPDVIHLNSFASRFAALPARLSGSGTVWYLTEYFNFSFPFGSAMRLLVRACSDAVVAVSHATLDYWSEKRSGAKYAVLYNGIPPHPAEPILFEKKEHDVVFVGRFSQEKGAADLADAISSLDRKGTPLSVAMVGGFESPEQERWLRGRVEKLGIDGLFTWHVQVPDPYEFIRRGRLLALPSHREGLARVLLEAMACRVPIVAARVGGIPEAVQDDLTGILIDAGDVDALARGLSTLARDRNLNERMGAAGYEVVLTKFSPAAFSRNLETIYSRVAS